MTWNGVPLAPPLSARSAFLETSATMPSPVDPTPSKNVCHCVQCSFQTAIADSPAHIELMIASALGVFGTQTHYSAWAIRNRAASTRQVAHSLSPIIVHVEPNGDVYTECAGH
jgi:hypothetical protein